jgi:hypothetical protein
MQEFTDPKVQDDASNRNIAPQGVHRDLADGYHRIDKEQLVLTDTERMWDTSCTMDDPDMPSVLRKSLKDVFPMIANPVIPFCKVHP